MLLRFRFTVSKKTCGSVLEKTKSFPGLDVPKLLINTSIRPASVTTSSTIVGKVSGLLAVLAACVFYALTKELWLIRWLVGAALGIYLLIKMVKRKSIF